MGAVAQVPNALPCGPADEVLAALAELPRDDIDSYALIGALTVAEQFDSERKALALEVQALRAQLLSLQAEHTAMFNRLVNVADQLKPEGASNVWPLSAHDAQVIRNTVQGTLQSVERGLQHG